MSLAQRFLSVLQDPPPAMAFEISEAGVAAARIGARAEMEFQPLKAGTLAISPLKENVIDSDDFAGAVRALCGAASGRKRREAAVILPDYAARLAVLDFDGFPTDAKEQASLLRFRLKRSVPFDVDSAALSYWAQPGAGKKHDVLVALAPLEIVSRYEAPFRASGMLPGLVTTSSLAAMELVPEGDLTVVAKLSGRTLSILVREKSAIKFVRCLEMASNGLDDVASALFPTLVYIEDNLGRAATEMVVCGFGARTAEAVQQFQTELGLPVEPVRSPLGPPGESNAGLLGYLHSVGRDN
jgi:type IV pilus assembly protein PilM